MSSVIKNKIHDIVKRDKARREEMKEEEETKQTEQIKANEKEFEDLMEKTIQHKAEHRGNVT